MQACLPAQGPGRQALLDAFQAGPHGRLAKPVRAHRLTVGLLKEIKAAHR